MVKYRVHEVAKDFNVSTKAISAILTEFSAAPKNHMQVLTEQELNIVFDYLTINNQVESIEKIFELTAKGAQSAEAVPEKGAAVKEETQAPTVAVEHTGTDKNIGSSNVVQKDTEKSKTDIEAQEKRDIKDTKTQAPAEKAQKPVGISEHRTPGQQQNRPSQQAKPFNAQQSGHTQQGSHAQQSGHTHQGGHAQQGGNLHQAGYQQGQKHQVPQTTRIPEKRVIDTSGATVNIAKYDERLEQYVPEKMANIKSGKEKWTKKNPDKRGGSMAAGAKKRQQEREKFQKLQLELAKKQQLKVTIPDEIAVGELATRMKKTGSEVVKQLIKLGTMASLSDIIDYDTAALVALELGCKVEREVVMTIEERLIDDSEDVETNLEPRSPVVVVMGHVDHGKTSLLDRIRHANVAEGEAGGITQHIGAYQIEVNGKLITFLDTPGHEAFTSMRARGAMVTDIAILVVAADDGIKPQTVEAINHAKAAEIPIIVAINKMDKEGANPERIKQQLTEYGLLSEDWGGDTIISEISAKKGTGIDNLLEMVLLTAEMRELKANPNRLAKGTVIEARLDKGRGPIATVLVQNGTLKQGDIIIAGTAVGRVRTMINDKGERLEEAGPSVPVEITGLSEAPGAGDTFNAVEDERMARELVEQRKHQSKLKTGNEDRKVTLEDLFSQIQQGEIKELAVIVKADVQGSAEAIKASLEKLTNEEVRVRVIHNGVGAINESDIMLASTSNAIVVGFNVRPEPSARDSAMRSGVDIRMYRIIYECIEEIEMAMKGLLAPKYREAALGHAEVRQVYKASKIGTIAGCYVLEGKLQRNAQVRVVRDGIVVHEGDLASLKRFKDDAKEVAAGYECGVSIEKFNDIKEGDIIEAYIMEQIQI